MTLDKGVPGMVLKVDSIGDSDLKERLMTMGLTPGIKVKVLRSAPLGDPMAIGLRSYNLAIRRKDAAHITVEEIEA
ncbi:MAG: ferrous iron transport protein A [Anaerovibrio sp.]|nr:ferrous iron transport protein A [Selenomonadaceae bacterium]MDD6397852.1 ferrous iron transport protein A [Selenomonadaceae bacterium]MDY6052722.1 ferrous iron transport protein A [Anaerovibrio sp.]